MSLVLLSLVVVMLAVLPLRTSRAQTDSELASTYAPILHFTSGEKFYPTTVDYILGNSLVMLRNSDGSATPFSPDHPTKFNLGNYPGPDWFLNNTLGSVEAISADYASKKDSIGYQAYVHVYSSATSQVVQYWLFYAYNNGLLNDHQGDIEVIQVFLDNAGNPQRALYSQHGAGENAAWGDVEKVDTHPVVYVAQGSHANYFRSWQGKFMIENDIVGSDGLTIQPNNLNLELLGEPGTGNHIASQNWLDFQGRWGFWGTDDDVALGRAGPVGPVFNQNSERWGDPQSYLSSTIGVDNTYFTLAWVVANVLLLFIIYVLAVGAWKIWGIVKLHRKGGLRTGKFLKGPGLIGIALASIAIIISIVALFLPWYNISASSETGPLAQTGGVNLLSIDGVTGMRVNLFLGSTSESTSGYRSLFALGFPFMLFILVGIILFVLDIIGVKSGKRLGLKMILGTIVLFLPFILIIVFMAMLPAFLPWASAIVPGGEVPPQVETMVRSIAGNPIYGSATQSFPVVGSTTVNWGFGIGAYLFIVAAVLRIAGGVIMRKSPELEEKPAAQPTPPAEPKPSETKPEEEKTQSSPSPSQEKETAATGTSP